MQHIKAIGLEFPDLDVITLKNGAEVVISQDGGVELAIGVYAGPRGWSDAGKEQITLVSTCYACGAELGVDGGPRHERDCPHFEPPADEEPFALRLAVELESVLDDTENDNATDDALTLGRQLAAAVIEALGDDEPMRIVPAEPQIETPREAFELVVERVIDDRTDDPALDQALDVLRATLDLNR